MRTLNVFLLALIFVVASGIVFYQLFNLELTRIPFLDDQTPQAQGQIYILSSKENERFMLENGYDIKARQDHILRIQQLLKKLGYDSKLLDIERLAFAKPGATLLALDIYALSDASFKDIQDFLKRGGNLFFNYRFGYFLPDGAFVGPKRIEQITRLRYIQSLERGATKATFIVPKMLSPLGGGVGMRSDLVRYDPIPLFRSATTPDALLSNWQITQPPSIDSKPLSVTEAGVMWHGRYKEGTWYYASFPAYTFLEMRPDQSRRYLGGALHYLTHTAHLVFYPFLRTPFGVFVSEDTEYKYPELTAFVKSCATYEINATLFCVAGLAKKHPDITRRAASYPNIEIASHSMTHTPLTGLKSSALKREIIESKKLLEQITGKEIIGFRPPKEQIDKKIRALLKKAGYRYIMERTRPQLLPFIEGDLVTLPRHGTDDYLYMVDFEWDENKILTQIMAETEFLRSIDALYTLSVHTHLLGYGSNIQILRRYFSILLRLKIPTYTGRELSRIATISHRLKAKIQENPRSLVITLFNNSDESIKGLKFRLYHPKIPKIKAVFSEILNTKATIVATNQKERYVDVEVENLAARASLTLIATLR